VFRLLALLVVLTVVVTFPQAIHLRTGVNDFGDPLLNGWALAWTPHAIRTGSALFDANIFYPERGTLALSETLIFPALLMAPFRAAGANPILLHNLTLLSGYVLSGLTMFLLVLSLTADWRGSLLAAVTFAISPLRSEHYPRVQLQLTYLMPLALYLVHRILDGDMRKRTTVLLGLAFGSLFYSSVYYAVYFATLLPIVVALCLMFRRDRNWQGAGRLALAGVVSAVMIAAALPAYFHNRQSVGERQMAELARGSAELRDYRRPNRNNLLYGDRNRVGPAERNLFTGYVLPIAAAAVVVSPVRVWLPYAGALVASVDLSLGLNGRSYGWLYQHLLPYRALRVPARFAVLVNMFLAVLAGIGCSHLLRRVWSERARNVMLAAMVGGVCLESLNRPLLLRDMPVRAPAVYNWLQEAPEGPIVEYPVGNLEGRIGPQDATYMHYSTTDWRPRLNGYSGFVPPSYLELLARMREFPAEPSVEYLRARHVRYLLVHESFYLQGGFDQDVQALQQAKGVDLRGIFVDSVLKRTYVYELRQ
jgi:hypothetical protein